jgi:hypothetical protein
VRSHLTSDRAVFTVGFVVQSAATKRLLVRGIGPTLASVGLAGGVADPRLEVFDAASLPIGGNDNWMPELAGRFAAMGAFALPAGSADAALLVDLPSRSGTAQVRATTEGLALIEIYDPTASVASKLVNLSALAQAGAGERALIAGFNIGGFGRKRLLIRAVGPGLAAFGVDGFLADPILEVYGTEGARITENDDWDAGLLPEFSAVGAPLLEPGSRDAALITTLTAGSVATVVVRSANGATGMALLEIYEAP